MNYKFLHLFFRIVKLVTDFDTNFELRAAEIRSLRNDFDEQLNMVRFLYIYFGYFFLNFTQFSIQIWRIFNLFSISCIF